MKLFRKFGKGILGIVIIFGLCFATLGTGLSGPYIPGSFDREVFFSKEDSELSVEEEGYLQNNKAGENGDEPEKKENKTAFLTFDDGPSEYTEQIVKILKEEGACATFFLIGEQITDEEVPVLKELLENGNEIGIHTYSHEEDIYSSKTAFLKDFRMARETIISKLGIEPRIYRFPWGSTSKYVKPLKNELIQRLARCGYTYEDWNVSAEDSVGRPGSGTIISNIRKDFAKHDEPVILMHDSGINAETVKALPEIIRMIREEGYSFGILSERSEPMQY